MRKLPEKIKRPNQIPRIPVAINEVIDYLYSARLVAGRNIRISETVNGIIIEADGGGTATTATGSARIGGLTSGPSGGSGAAVWREAVDAADGTWTATGATVPVRVLTLK